MFRLKESLGHEPSEEQLATSLKISCAELQLKLIECALAREKLAMSNVRLVMSIAQRYDNMGAEMADLIQNPICNNWDKQLQKASQGNLISTPPTSGTILPGITRKTVINIAPVIMGSRDQED
ncbi:hypothetical protein ACSBR1_038104 [Camellia fascicularis]